MNYLGERNRSLFAIFFCNKSVNEKQGSNGSKEQNGGREGVVEKQRVFLQIQAKRFIVCIEDPWFPKISVVMT